jgi:hypothetical protein
MYIHNVVFPLSLVCLGEAEGEDEVMREVTRESTPLAQREYDDQVYLCVCVCKCLCVCISV